MSSIQNNLYTNSVASREFLLHLQQALAARDGAVDSFSSAPPPTKRKRDWGKDSKMREGLCVCKTLQTIVLKIHRWEHS